MNYLLRKELRGHDLARVVAALEELPNDRMWRVAIEEAKSERSAAQNAYLYGVAYDLIGKKHGLEKDDLHVDFLKRHFGVKLVKCPKDRFHPEGLKEAPVRTTTKDEKGRRSVLGKTPFSEFTEFVIRTAAMEYEVVVPPPDPDYAMHREDAEEQAA